MKKLLASDYDNTFYLNDEDIEINKEAVREFRDAGNLFVIATGRSYMDLQKKVNAYNLVYDYAIIDHGAGIIDNEGNGIDSVYIENSIVPSIKNDLHLETSISNFCCSMFESRVDFDHRNLTKIDVKYSTKEEAWQVNEEINKKYGDYVISYFLTSNAIEIISNKTNKSHAIGLLVKLFSIDKNNIYTIGDGYSDMEMIRDFNGYRMENSVDGLKKMTDKRVKSVAELVEIIMKTH